MGVYVQMPSLRNGFFHSVDLEGKQQKTLFSERPFRKMNTEDILEDIDLL